MNNDQSEQLAALRHSAAHLLAAAVLQIWPDAKPTIGPSTDKGFYYDFDFGDATISDKDFPKIEKKMKKLVQQWNKFSREEVSKEAVLERFADNEYKSELIEEFAEEGKTLTLYRSGKFIDLCKGGHIENPAKQLKHFKLLSVAGAYWRGDEKRPMLTRMYGTAFFSQKELDDYCKMLEEAKLRDHKKLGKELDLFTFSELVGPGLPLWTPKGALLRNILDEFVWELRKEKGYDRVEIPHITKKDLYEVSGHWEKFGDELFRITTREGHQFVMKPMNCPHHTQIFARKPFSYREMPQRYANTTMVYRDEQTGELSGLSRVRSITQDDAHVFCRTSQIKQELHNNWDIIEKFYGAVGFDLYIRLSMSDPAEPEKYLGDREIWDTTEQMLRDLAKERGVEVVEAPGEAAFYGPKLDFMAKDSLGREWQVATNQLDMLMPDRFDLFCINEKGEKERVVMIHAAIMGSIERYVSILIEHFAGKFPVWLAPVQVKVLPVSEKYFSYAQKVVAALEDAEVRVEFDSRSERLQSKIRDAQIEQVPYMLIVGEKEEESQSVAVRNRESGDEGSISLTRFIDRLVQDINEKSLS